jgi:hypothetical protein
MPPEGWMLAAIEYVHNRLLKQSEKGRHFSIFNELDESDLATEYW